MRQLMELRLVLCRLSKVPAFCPGLGADSQAPPFKGSERQSRQMRWLARIL